jgi:hypothetical protein
METAKTRLMNDLPRDDAIRRNGSEGRREPNSGAAADGEIGAESATECIPAFVDLGFVLLKPSAG